ncbi:TPA: N-acetylmannosamine kinase [Klebsiella aerogenes]|nr:N-acetylmannosamine kinase [Klebsiella aerogenes]
MTTLAIDIGGTKLAAALVDDDLNLLKRRELPTPASQMPEALCSALQELIVPLFARAQRVAIASTGIISGGVLSAINPHNLGGLQHFPLTQTLEKITGLPTLAVNDAQAAAWAEYHALGGECRDMVFITVSTGVGGGVVSNGRLITGDGGLAGHLGHTLADPNGPLCGCGRRGCVEVVASGRGMATAAQGELSGCDAKTIFIRAGQGDEQAIGLIHRSAQTLARLIADVKATTDCQRVVVGGSIGLAEGYLEMVRAYLAQETSVYHVMLQPAHYRHDAGLLGAVLLARENNS